MGREYILYLLHTETIPTPPAEGDDELAQVPSLVGSLDPALGFEAFWLRKDPGVHVNKVTDHTDRRL